MWFRQNAKGIVEVQHKVKGKTPSDINLLWAAGIDSVSTLHITQSFMYSVKVKREKLGENKRWGFWWLLSNAVLFSHNPTCTIGASLVAMCVYSWYIGWLFGVYNTDCRERPASLHKNSLYWLSEQTFGQRNVWIEGWEFLCKSSNDFEFHVPKQITFVNHRHTPVSHDEDLTTRSNLQLFLADFVLFSLWGWTQLHI